MVNASPIGDLQAPAEWGPARTRTVSWYDPTLYGPYAMENSGLATLQAMARGELPPPPILMLMGAELRMEVEPAHIRLWTTADESVYNPLGMAHGGYVTTLLDTVAACAVHTTLPAGVPYTTAEIKVTFLRSVRAGTELVAHGWVTKPGRRAAFAEADLRDADGVLYASASTTCVMLA